MKWTLSSQVKECLDFLGVFSANSALCSLEGTHTQTTFRKNMFTINLKLPQIMTHYPKKGIFPVLI